MKYNVRFSAMHRPSLICVSFIFHTETMERNGESVIRVESYATLQKEELTLKYALQVCNIKLDIAFLIDRHKENNSNNINLSPAQQLLYDNLLH